MIDLFGFGVADFPFYYSIAIFAASLLGLGLFAAFGTGRFLRAYRKSHPEQDEEDAASLGGLLRDLKEAFQND